MKCPNCGGPVEGHPENGCILAALIQVVRERGEVDEVELLRIHTECWVDSLWEHMNRIIDDLEAGEYSKEV